MKFILIFGPPAVGKMTVGQELEKITGLKLFHNHMTIELVLPFFYYESPSFQKLVNLFRKEIFKEVAKSDLYGIIFTFVWAFNLKSDEKYVNNVVRIFKKARGEIYYVELEAGLRERLKRNKGLNRLQHKPSKRDTESSEKYMLYHVKHCRFNTNEKEFKRKNYIKINNSRLSAKDTAKLIKAKFNL